MIWFSKELAITNQPQNTVVRIEGTYNAPDTDLPRILVRLYIESDDNTITKNLYEKNPAMLQYQTPEAEDVHNKYRHNIQKILNKITSMNYDELIASV